LVLYARKLLERLAKLVISAFERTKRISQSRLSNKFERSLAHPLNDVDLLRAIHHHVPEFLTKLSAGSLKHGLANVRLGAHLSYDSIKDGDHISHVADVEDGV